MPLRVGECKQIFCVNMIAFHRYEGNKRHMEGLFKHRKTLSIIMNDKFRWNSEQYSKGIYKNAFCLLHIAELTAKGFQRCLLQAVIWHPQGLKIVTFKEALKLRLWNDSIPMVKSQSWYVYDFMCWWWSRSVGDRNNLGAYLLAKEAHL